MRFVPYIAILLLLVAVIVLVLLLRQEKSMVSYLISSRQSKIAEFYSW